MANVTMKKYKVFLEDSDNCYRVFIPATSEAEARKYVSGNGDIIAVKDVTNEYPINIDKVVTALAKDGFGEAEVDLIMRTLLVTRIAE